MDRRNSTRRLGFYVVIGSKSKTDCARNNEESRAAWVRKWKSAVKKTAYAQCATRGAGCYGDEPREERSHVLYSKELTSSCDHSFPAPKIELVSILRTWGFGWLRLDAELPFAWARIGTRGLADERKLVGLFALNSALYFTKKQGNDCSPAQ